jgi:hypothetical protein
MDEDLMGKDENNGMVDIGRLSNTSLFYVRLFL